MNFVVVACRFQHLPPDRRRHGSANRQTEAQGKSASISRQAGESNVTANSLLVFKTSFRPSITKAYIRAPEDDIEQR